MNIKKRNNEDRVKLIFTDNRDSAVDKTGVK